MALRKCAGIFLRLTPRGDHELVPRPIRRALSARSVVRFDQVELAGDVQRFRAAFLAALLRLHDEAMLLVKVNAPGAFGAVEVGKRDLSLEGVIAEASVFLGRRGLLDADDPAELVSEGLEVRALIAARSRPSGDERLKIAFGGNDSHGLCKMKMSQSRSGIEPFPER